MAYFAEPVDKEGFTGDFDQFYTRFAQLYDLALKLFPIWRRWIGAVLPHVQGQRVLEVSFGTGYLLDQYGADVDVVGIEFNGAMIDIARGHVPGRLVALQQADVYHLPFKSGTFDTVVNTMAFTGYADGKLAMAELKRVLLDGGRLVMVDINYPRDGNRMGVFLAGLWVRLGDILRDMSSLFAEAGFSYQDHEIGGWGSVHLYVATKTG
jgi:ubiquinone/menaquinone biosynthesis C-methylase UbiE